MKATKALVIIAATLLMAVPALPGCGDSAARDKVSEAVGLIETSQTLLEDLVSLDKRLNILGTRSSDVDSTIAEGKSLAEMALLDVDELEARYTQARTLLQEVADMGGAGDYAGYARLALAAVETELEALVVNRQLLTAVWDMLDVLPLAESQEQLSYYIEEIDRLTGEVSDLLQRGAEAAQEADRYYREHGL